MQLPKITWNDNQQVTKTPFYLVLIIALLIGFNVFLNLKIKNTSQEINALKKSGTQLARKVDPKYTQRIDLGQKSCPSVKAGNPNATLKFKIFTTETCPFCVAENKVLDELLPQYGDLFYGEWYDLLTCQKESEQYKISGVPTFVFTAKGIEKKPAYGFLDKQQMTDYICKVSGAC